MNATAPNHRTSTVNRTLRSLATAGIITLAAGLTACASNDAPQAVDPAKLSPIDEYLSAAWGGNLSPEEQERRWAEIQTNTENAVAECMKAEGFQFTPNLPITTEPVPMPEPGEETYDPESERWVSQYGYGIVVSPWGDMAVDPIPLPMPEPGADPNSDYFNSLSPSEQVAYSEALHGPAPTEEELQSGEWEVTWENSGCYGAANHEFGAVNLYEDEQFRPLLDEIDAFRATVWEDREFADLDAAWADCMADAGQAGFTVQSDAATKISDEHAKLWESAGEDGIDPKDPAVIALGEEEIVVALADLSCRQQTKYLAERQRIQFELEEQFVEDNKAALDAFRAAAEQLL